MDNDESKYFSFLTKKLLTMPRDEWFKYLKEISPWVLTDINIGKLMLLIKRHPDYTDYVFEEKKIKLEDAAFFQLLCQKQREAEALPNYPNCDITTIFHDTNKPKMTVEEMEKFMKSINVNDDFTVSYRQPESDVVESSEEVENTDVEDTIN